MDNLGELLHGFTIAVTMPHLLLMAVGVLLGILVGVLPGLGAPNGVSLLLPLTFGMQPVSAIILLSCMYWGALFGGSVTSILFNIPGEPSSATAWQRPARSSSPAHPSRAPGAPTGFSHPGDQPEQPTGCPKESPPGSRRTSRMPPSAH